MIKSINDEVALFTDTHFGVKKNSDKFIIRQMNFFDAVFIPYLMKKKIDTLFFLGDLFDNRNSINIRIKNAVIDLFNKLKNFKIYMIVGNHDCYFNTTTEINSLKMFEQFSNITVIKEITTIDINGTKIVMVPWIVDSDNFIKEFSSITGDLCFGHFNILGANMNKVKRSEDGLSKTIFDDKFKKVFSGHFHIRSKQKKGKSEIVYLGSPFQLNRGDANERRGFVSLNIKTTDYEYIDNDISVKYISLKFPQKFTRSMIKGNVVDIHIDYDDYNEQLIEKYINKIESFEPILSPKTFIDNKKETNLDVDISDCNIGSITDLMKEYVDASNIGNKDEIYNKLVELYDKSRGDI